MEPFRYHVYACEQQKAEGIPSCSARGSPKTIEALRREIGTRGLVNEVQITTCGSLGLCERGPNLVVYPEGIWYSGVTPADVPELVEQHFQRGTPLERLVNRDSSAVAEEIRGNRDKMLAGMRAREAAGAMPDDLAAKIRGFQESRVILTAIDLDAFTAIGDGANAAQAAERMGADQRAAALLLNALVALGLAEKSGETYRTTPVSKRFFTAGGANDARLATKHYEGLWSRWSTLTEAVRKGTAIERKEMGERSDEAVQAFIAAMHRNAGERAAVVVGAVGAKGVRRMLDVGGGSGAYSIAFAKASDDLRAVLFDLPNVLPIARGHIREASLEGRIETREGDLRTDSFGEGFDLVLLSAICHMLGEDENRDLLVRCRKALAPGGRLVIQDFILEADGTSPKQAALFSLNMLVGTRGGRSYTADEYQNWLTAAGFSDVNRVRLPGPTGLMIGTA